MLKVKERLTGAIILVALIVLLVPELLHGPIRADHAAAAASSAEEPPLRSYTIDLCGRDAARRAARPQATQRSGRQPTPLPRRPQPADRPRPPPQRPRQRPAPQRRPVPQRRAPQPEPPASAARHAPRRRHARLPRPAPARAVRAASTGAAAAAGGCSSAASPASANAERLARQVHAQGFSASVSQGSGGRRAVPGARRSGGRPRGGSAARTAPARRGHKRRDRAAVAAPLRMTGSAQRSAGGALVQSAPRVNDRDDDELR